MGEKRNCKTNTEPFFSVFVLFWFFGNSVREAILKQFGGVVLLSLGAFDPMGTLVISGDIFDSHD